MEYPERQRPSMPNDSASRSGPVDDSTYQGFHNYATSDLYDTNGGTDRWPDNLASSGPPGSGSGETTNDEPPPKRDYWAPLLWTMAWYAVPALVLVLRALLLPTGSEQTRTGATADLVANAPLWVLGLVGGLIFALALRRASQTWRAVTIGLCAAIVSGGAVTVLYRM